jgi:hypothetical protein
MQFLDTATLWLAVMKQNEINAKKNCIFAKKSHSCVPQWFITMHMMIFFLQFLVATRL